MRPRGARYGGVRLGLTVLWRKKISHSAPRRPYCELPAWYGRRARGEGHVAMAVVASGGLRTGERWARIVVWSAGAWRWYGAPVVEPGTIPMDIEADDWDTNYQRYTEAFALLESTTKAATARSPTPGHVRELWGANSEELNAALHALPPQRPPS